MKRPPKRLNRRQFQPLTGYNLNPQSKSIPLRRRRGSTLLVGAALSMLTSSCEVYHYDDEEVTLRRGEVYRGYELSQVAADGVSLRRQSSGPTASTFYSTTGRPHMKGSHPLGNNESVRVISVDPAAQRAELEFGWLDRVAPVAMPPF